MGSLPWCWEVPYKYNFPGGQKFVETFSSKYNRYPSTSGASAYTILWEYKDAVERAKSLDLRRSSGPRRALVSSV